MPAANSSGDGCRHRSAGGRWHKHCWQPLRSWHKFADPFAPRLTILSFDPCSACSSVSVVINLTSLNSPVNYSHSYLPLQTKSGLKSDKLWREVLQTASKLETASKINPGNKKQTEVLHIFTSFSSQPRERTFIDIEKNPRKYYDAM